MKKNEVIIKENEEKDSRTRKILLYIIIIIIIILSIITSCSCTSRFFGRIGNRFINDGDHAIDGSNNKEVITNQNLKFDYDRFEISLSDEFSKIRFNYSKITPEKFTCSTSDASIATCFVKDNHVIIIPKKPGTVTVTVRTEVNDKIYEATTSITITDSKKGITLSSTKGTINLAYSNKKETYYHLVGIIGNINITSSDPSIAKAEVIGNKIVITGLKPGNAKITISVNDNGKVYEAIYTVNIVNNPKAPVPTPVKKDHNSNLASLSVSKGELKPNFNKYNKNYEVFVGEDISRISLKATAESNKSKITYIYNFKEYKDFVDMPITNGKNIVTIKVVAEDSTTSVYVVTIIKKTPITPEKSSDASLKDITITVGELKPSFNPETENYKVTVPSDTNTVTIEGVPNSNKAIVKYIYNDKEYTEFKDIPIKTGENVVSIIVTAEDNTEKIYTVTIDKEKNANNNLANLTVSAGALDPIFNKDTLKYDVVLPYDVKKITVTGTQEDYRSTIEYYYNNEKYKQFSEINLTKDDNIVFVVVTAEDGSTKTYVVDIHRYYLDGKKEYMMNFDSSTKETDIILNTNIFKDSINVEQTDDKNLKICSKNNLNSCINISTTSDSLKSLEYTGELNSPTSLSIKATADSPGSAYIHVVGSVNGVTINDFYIKLDVLQSYIISLNAQGGLFNEFSKDIYTFKLGAGETFDLNTAGIPYLIDESNPCLYYEFMGYSKSKENKELFKDLNNMIISYDELDSDLTLYAVYNMDKKIELTNEHKTIWVSDVPIFIDKAYFEEFKGEKIIAPGSYGDYTMHLINETKNNITLTGMTLKEETICVNENGINGCLNMGYVVKDGSVNQNYHFHNNHDYKILNEYATTKNWAGNYNENKFDFDISTKNDTTIKAGETLDLVLIWKWVEINDYSDKVDTLIGNVAASKIEDATVNDLYTLHIGIHYDTIIENCPSKI